MDGPRMARAFVAFQRLVGCGHFCAVEIEVRRLRAMMKLRVSPSIPINGTRSKVLRPEEGIPAICPPVGHHATLPEVLPENRTAPSEESRRLNGRKSCWLLW